LRVAVVQVWKIELAVGGADFHVVEGVAYVGVAHLVEAHGVGIVRLNGHESDAFVFVVSGQLADALFVKLSGRAVIAGEDNHKDFAFDVVLEAMGLAVDSGETKIGGLCADREDWDGGTICPCGARRENAGS